ncbi:hypothetical protein [Alkalihalobacillus deserti]|uniref:hypothetical protein n=1 Tax=Alkalihalobacillus deserti TaxID=2879466 RepID=UPI001D15D922|nr:hypothetical protein [Alkalihalobacillus deserti]
MSNEQKPQPQRDFFSDFMFGRPPMPPEQEEKDTDDTESKLKPEDPQSSEENQSPDNKQPDQLESIFALVQSLGPFIDKLAPLAGAVSSYFSQNKIDSTNKTSSKNKNAND